LGRVYKDRWKAALEEEDLDSADVLLDEAIKAYLIGFETDWRDAYPGVNALSLMEIKNPSDPRIKELFPIVSYAVNRRLSATEPDYWDYATKLELAVLSKDKDTAEEMRKLALAKLKAAWEAETTLNNLQLISKAREQRQESTPWANDIEKAIQQKIVDQKKSPKN